MVDPTEIVDKYNCSQCSHRTASSFQLEHHIQRNHRNVYAAELFHAIVEPQQFPCICCGLKCYHQFELYEHCKQSHNPRTGEDNESTSFCEEFVRYPCHYCGFTADSSLCFARHHDLCGKASPSVKPQNSAEDADDAQSQDLNQTDAGASKNLEALESEVLNRTNSIRKKHLLKCNHCSYRAKHKSVLKKHFLKHAKDEEIDWFQCSQCAHRTKYKPALRIHMLKHAKNKDIVWFHCNHCSYRSKTRSNLNRHMLLQHVKNEEIVWFQCNHCSYKAKQKSHLRRHALQHAKIEEIDWFQCNLCRGRVPILYRSLKLYHLKKGRKNTQVALICHQNTEVLPIPP